MRTKFLKFLTIIAIGVAIVSCKNKADEAATTEAEEVATSEATSTKYMLDTDTSVIEWTGYKPTGKHNGTIDLESGVFTVNDGKVESGTFMITMNSLKDSEGNAKLEGHLKSADFFEVEAYPNAAFDVTGYEMVDGKAMLSGNLTLKDAKNNVTFPVTTSQDGNMFTLTSEMFTIDRSKWNVKYGSKSFFDDLGDKFINDDIELKITVKATTKAL
ncbi:MAG: lipid-binding protein [Bacteroidetes bacterium]|nr:MAG: lipid-binding protein [Bacteroidota bacterium]